MLTGNGDKKARISLNKHHNNFMMYMWWYSLSTKRMCEYVITAKFFFKIFERSLNIITIKKHYYMDKKKPCYYIFEIFRYSILLLYV